MVLFKKKNNRSQVKIRLWKKIFLILFGLCLTIILLELGLRLGGFIFLSLQEYRNIISIKQKGSYRIMCLGESTTQGQYPSFLEEILNQRNIGIKFSVIDKGRGGTNTPSILSQIESYIGTYNPDIVVAMMGINDWIELMPYESSPDSRMTLFLKSFRTYKLGRLLWLHISAKVKEIGLDSLKNSKPVIKRIALKHTNGTPEDNYANSMNPITFEELFKKAIELNPQDDKAYRALGWLYRDQGKYHQAEELFKKAIELNPQNLEGYGGLGWLYLAQDKYHQAEELFKKAIELNPQDDKAYRALSILYEAMGKPGLAEEYDKKVKELRRSYYNPMTINNYKRLKAILYKRNIRLVCMQYPMRSIEPLKKIFEGQEGVIFVDNEHVFREALKKASYKEYFRDMFGGNFGHCTKKGNRLLAENIANVILKEIFGK